MIVCVTGVHRSGTSALARIVNLLGVDLGRKKSLMRALPENPKGFWENTAIVGFNDRLLARLGGTWDDPPRLEEGWERDPALVVERRAARRLLRRELGFFGARGWKDPRACILHAFWRDAVPQMRTIASIRHPSEVAASLQRRNGFQAQESAPLWLRYVTSLGLSDPGALVVTYESLYENPVAVAVDAATFLGLPLPSARGEAAIRDSFERSLRHHVAKEVAGGDETIAVAAGVYDVLARRELREVLPLLRGVNEMVTSGASAGPALRQIEELALREV